MGPSTISSSSSFSSGAASISSSAGETMRLLTDGATAALTSSSVSAVTYSYVHGDAASGLESADDGTWNGCRPSGVAVGGVDSAKCFMRL